MTYMCLFSFSMLPYYYYYLYFPIRITSIFLSVSTTFSVDGLWSPWTPWTPCSTSCGGGSRSRRRTCDNPAPEYGGHSCDGDASETDTCNEKLCPVDGAWSVWSNWVTCPVTCGGGTTQRYRTCDNPLPLYGGNDCPGLANETMLCSGSPCPGKIFLLTSC